MFILNFTTVQSSLLTLLVIVVMGIIFYVEKKIIFKKEDTIKKINLMLIYLVSLLLLFASLILILWLWDIDIVTIAQDNFDKFIISLENAITRLIWSTALLFFGLFIIKIFKLTLIRIGLKEGPHQRRKKTVSRVINSIIRYTVWIFIIISILALWGVNVVPALAGLGILGLIIGLGAQKFINDLISGFFIIFEHHYDVGDKIEVQGFKGDVIDIGLKTTKIRNFKNEIKIVSNGEISNLINFSQSVSVALIDFGIAYGEDMQKTIDLLNTELPKMMEIIPEIVEPPFVLGVTELANSSVNMRVMCKTLNEQHYGVERKLRQRIKEILDQNDIEIPFPQVVMHRPKENK